MKKITLFLLLVLLLLPLLGQRRWNSKGFPVSSKFSFAKKHLMAMDGSGGVIVAWMDNGKQGYGMYAQRLNRGGTRLWGDRGVSVYTGSPVGEGFTMVADGAGGVIFAWKDTRSGNADIYAQRIKASGKKLWGANGTPVCVENHEQISSALTADGSGGAIFAWHDFRLASSSDIFAQRLDADGNRCWAAGGIPICTAANGNLSLTVTSDNAGGAIFTWDDCRSSSDWNIFIQRVSGSGKVLWPVDGVAVCSDPSWQGNPKADADGASGAILIWSDLRSGIVDIYMQRIDSSGNGIWQANGVPIASRSNDQYEAAITADGSGGVVIAWIESLSHDSTHHDVYAQRIDSSGNPLWTAQGIPVCTASGNQLGLNLAADQLGGAIISWTDWRTLGPVSNIYTSKLDARGAPLWGENGCRVSLNSHSQIQSRLVCDGRGGAIVIWQDVRSKVVSIFAQRLSPIFDVNFISTEGGKIVGDSSQKVFSGASRTPVEALHNSGYRFRYWSGTGGFYSTDNPLLVTRVIENMTIRANFVKKNAIVDPASLQ